MSSLFLYQIKLHLLSCFTLGEEHHLLFLKYEGWSEESPGQSDRIVKEAWAGDNLSWPYSHSDVSDWSQASFGHKSLWDGGHCYCLEGWRLWNTQDKQVSWGSRSRWISFSFNHLATGASLCPRILVFREFIQSAASATNSQSPRVLGETWSSRCWEQLLQAFLILLSSSERCRWAPLTSCSVCVFSLPAVTRYNPTLCSSGSFWIPGLSELREKTETCSPHPPPIPSLTL